VERAKAKLDFDSDKFRQTEERDGVKLYIKEDDGSSSVPTVKGTCIVENASSSQVLGVIAVRLSTKLKSR
jgi:hypothetical protein